MGKPANWLFARWWRPALVGFGLFLNVVMFLSWYSGVMMWQVAHYTFFTVLGTAYGLAALYFAAVILPEFLEGKRDHNRLVGGILATGAVMWVIGAHIIEPLLLPALFAARYHFITILPSRWKSESWETRALFVALFLCIEQHANAMLLTPIWGLRPMVFVEETLYVVRYSCLVAAAGTLWSVLAMPSSRMTTGKLRESRNLILGALLVLACTEGAQWCRRGGHSLLEAAQWKVIQNGLRDAFLGPTVLGYFHVYSTGGNNVHVWSTSPHMQSFLEDAKLSLNSMERGDLGSSATKTTGPVAALTRHLQQVGPNVKLSTQMPPHLSKQMEDKLEAMRMNIPRQTLEHVLHHPKDPALAAEVREATDRVRNQFTVALLMAFHRSIPDVDMFLLEDEEKDWWKKAMAHASESLGIFKTEVRDNLDDFLGKQIRERLLRDVLRREGIDMVAEDDGGWSERDKLLRLLVDMMPHTSATQEEWVSAAFKIGSALLLSEEGSMWRLKNEWAFPGPDERSTDEGEKEAKKGRGGDVGAVEEVAAGAKVEEGEEGEEEAVDRVGQVASSTPRARSMRRQGKRKSEPPTGSPKKPKEPAIEPELVLPDDAYVPQTSVNRPTWPGPTPAWVSWGVIAAGLLSSGVLVAWMVWGVWKRAGRTRVLSTDAVELGEVRKAPSTETEHTTPARDEAAKGGGEGGGGGKKNKRSKRKGRHHGHGAAPQEMRPPPVVAEDAAPRPDEPGTPTLSTHGDEARERAISDLPASVVLEPERDGQQEARERVNAEEAMEKGMKRRSRTVKPKEQEQEQEQKEIGEDKSVAAETVTPPEGMVRIDTESSTRSRASSQSQMTTGSRRDASQRPKRKKNRKRKARVEQEEEPVNPLPQQDARQRERAAKEAAQAPWRWSEAHIDEIAAQLRARQQLFFSLLEQGDEKRIRLELAAAAKGPHPDSQCRSALALLRDGTPVAQALGMCGVVPMHRVNEVLAAQAAADKAAVERRPHDGPPAPSRPPRHPSAPQSPPFPAPESPPVPAEVPPPSPEYQQRPAAVGVPSIDLSEPFGVTPGGGGGAPGAVGSPEGEPSVPLEEPTGLGFMWDGPLGGLGSGFGDVGGLADGCDSPRGMDTLFTWGSVLGDWHPPSPAAGHRDDSLVTTTETGISPLADPFLRQDGSTSPST